MKKYGDLLPSYLSGSNVLAHAELIETQDQNIYEKLCELRNALALQRPILIERVQEEPMRASITVHIHSPFLIRSITIEKGYPTPYATVTESYDEDDCITEYTYIYTEDNSETVNVLPYCNVTVETYEDITYTKGYPENDEKEGTQYDHDEYLDIIGNLLGLPRRTYKEVVSGGQDPAEYEGLYPAYFTKVHIPGHEHETGDLLTEDDYYYSQRMKHFCENVGSGNLLKTMLEVLYEIRNAKTFNLTNRTTTTEETEGLVGNNVMAIEQETTYSNIDYTNQIEILSQYIPVTRNLIIVTPSESDLRDVTYDTSDFATNYVPISVSCVYSNDEWETENPLKYAPITAKLTINNVDIETEALTDENGIATLKFGGIPPRSFSSSVPFYALYDEPYEIEYSPVYSTVDLSTPVSDNATLDLSAWKYGKYNNTSISQLTPPFIDESLLNTGKGELVYTPILKRDLIGNDGYTIDCEFYYTSPFQFLCLGKVTQREIDTALIVKNMLRIHPGEYEAHEPDTARLYSVTFKFYNGRCFVYYDQIYTGLYVDYRSFHDLLSFCAYNGRNNVEYGLKLKSLTVLDNVDITSIPSGALSVLDIFTATKWTNRQATGTTREPVVSNSEYDVGRNYYTVFDDYTVNENTRNKVIEIEFNTQTTSGFRIGLVHLTSSNISWYTSLYDASNDYSRLTTGTHILKFVCDENGNWDTYIDGNRTDTNSFTLTNQRKIGIINYNSNAVKILGIRAYTNNWTLLLNENATDGFNLENWTGNGTRSIQADGTLLITRPNNNNLLNIEIPSNDWLLTVDIEPTDNSGTLHIVNDTEGSTMFRYLLSAKTSIIENDSSQTESKRTNLENFVDGSSVTRNTLYVKRTGNNITFSYKGIDNNDVTYTREYEDADGITGINFYKYATNNNFTVHSVKLLNQGKR